MKRQEFELDVYNRQRNIVFPDTVLNEGRFYRTIFARHAQFTRGQRLALVAYGLCLAIPGSVGLAGSVALFAQSFKSDAAAAGFEAYSIPFLWTMIVGAALMFRGLFPPKTTRLMRLREYRRWPRG